MSTTMVEPQSPPSIRDRILPLPVGRNMSRPLPAPLRLMARLATIVGIGGTTREASEFVLLQQWLGVRLVEELGFRAIALDEDWTLGLELDGYVRTGIGDPAGILLSGRRFSATQELLTAVKWIRAYNNEHPNDPVRIFGINADNTRASAYDAVEIYLRERAPQLLPELQPILARLRPAESLSSHTQAYRAEDDQEAKIRQARMLKERLARLRVEPAQQWAVRHAEAILDYHEYHSRTPDQILSYSTPRLADNLIWWHEMTGAKVVYWGGVAHTAAAPHRVLSQPHASGPSAGYFVRQRLGPAYLSIGLTFDRGYTPRFAPPAPPNFVKSVLAEPAPDSFFLDLRSLSAEHPSIISASNELRLIGPNYDPSRGNACTMSGCSLREWFDGLIHIHKVRPVLPLPVGPRWPWSEEGSRPVEGHRHPSDRW